MNLKTIDLIDLIDSESAPPALLGNTGPVEVLPLHGSDRTYGSGAAQRERTVLVVDDDPEIRNMLRMSLALEGFRVDCVADGASALEAVENNQPDVMLLDIMMPVLDGYSVMKHLHEAPDATLIPVIILSAKAGDEDVWEGWSCGADSYITKPLDLDVLLSEIDRVTSMRCAA